MREWRPWDWIAYLGLFAVAIVEALDAGIKNSTALAAKMPNFVTSELWAFTPLVLISISTVILLVRLFRHRNAKTATPLKNIYKRVYDKGEIVELDGHAFYDCTFNEPVFRWHGGRFFISNITIYGARRFETLNSTVKETIDTLKYLHFLGDQDFANSWKPVPAEHFGRNT